MPNDSGIRHDVSSWMNPRVESQSGVYAAMTNGNLSSVNWQVHRITAGSANPRNRETFLTNVPCSHFFTTEAN